MHSLIPNRILMESTERGRDVFWPQTTRASDEQQHVWLLLNQRNE